MIAALHNSSAQDRNHIPYRNSKFTHLLKPFMSGQDAKVVMIVNVTAVEEH